MAAKGKISAGTAIYLDESAIPVDGSPLGISSGGKVVHADQEKVVAIIRDVTIQGRQYYVIRWGTYDGFVLASRVTEIV